MRVDESLHLRAMVRLRDVYGWAVNGSTDRRSRSCSMPVVTIIAVNSWVGEASGGNNIGVSLAPSPRVGSRCLSSSHAVSGWERACRMEAYRRCVLSLSRASSSPMVELEVGAKGVSGVVRCLSCLGMSFRV